MGCVLVPRAQLLSCLFLKEFQRKGRSDEVDKYILPVQIYARFIRFHPTNRHNRSCLRVEVFGTRGML